MSYDHNFMTSPMIPSDDVVAPLSILDYLSDLFTSAGKETFTRDEVLVVLNLVKNDPEIFAPDDVLDYEMAAMEAEQE